MRGLDSGAWLGPWPDTEVVSTRSSVIRHNPYGEVCDPLAELFIVAHLYSSLTPGSFQHCKLETPLRKRRSRVSITNEFSVKRQRVSEAIGSIDVSTDAEQRPEYADINAEPRVSLLSLLVLLPKWTHYLGCTRSTVTNASLPPLSPHCLNTILCDTPFHGLTKTSIVHLLGDASSLRQIASLPHVQRPCSL